MLCVTLFYCIHQYSFKEINIHDTCNALHCMYALTLYVGGACCSQLLATWQDANKSTQYSHECECWLGLEPNSENNQVSFTRMSVRSRIEAFEALSKDTDNSNESNNNYCNNK